MYTGDAVSSAQLLPDVLQHLFPGSRLGSGHSSLAVLCNVRPPSGGDPSVLAVPPLPTRPANGVIHWLDHPSIHPSIADWSMRSNRGRMLLELGRCVCVCCSGFSEIRPALV